MARDIMRRKETLPEPPALLNPAQGQAIAALMGGATVTAAAQYAEVSRATLHRWLSDDPAFIAAYNSARQELADAVREKLRSLAGEAVAVVQTILTDPGVPMGLRYKAALEVIRAATEGADGPTDVVDAEIAVRRKKGSRKRQELLSHVLG